MAGNLGFLSDAEQSRVTRSKFDNGQLHLYSGRQGIGSRWEYVSGLVEMPLAKSVSGAASSAPVRVLRVCAPYWKRHVEFSMQKQKNPPIIPSPVGTEDLPLVGATIDLPYPSMSGDGFSYDWSATGRYSYIQADQFSVACATGLPTAVAPVITIGQMPGLHSTLGIKTSQDAIYPTENPTWSFADPTVFPATLMSHQLVLGFGVTFDDLKL